MNVQLCVLNIRKMYQSHPVSSERGRNSDTAAVHKKCIDPPSQSVYGEYKPYMCVMLKLRFLH